MVRKQGDRLGEFGKQYPCTSKAVSSPNRVRFLNCKDLADVSGLVFQLVAFGTKYE